MSHKYGVERDKPRLKTHKRERLNRCNGQAFVFKHGEAKYEHANFSTDKQQLQPSDHGIA